MPGPWVDLRRLLALKPTGNQTSIFNLISVSPYYSHSNLKSMAQRRVIEQSGPSELNHAYCSSTTTNTSRHPVPHHHLHTSSLVDHPNLPHQPQRADTRHGIMWRVTACRHWVFDPISTWKRKFWPSVLTPLSLHLVATDQQCHERVKHSSSNSWRI